MKRKIILSLVCFASLAGLTGCEIILRSFKKYECRTSVMPEPKTSNDFVTASRYHYNAGEHECAYTAAEQALRLKKDNVEALNARAMAHYGFEENSAALTDFQTSAWLDPNHPETFYGRSLVYQKIDDPDNALINLDKAVELAQNSNRFRAIVPFWKNKRGKLYLKKGDIENALADFSAAIEMMPENRFFYDDRAVLYLQIGKTNEAEADRKKSAELKIIAEQNKSSA